MVEITHNAEIAHPIPKDRLVEVFLGANGFFPHTLSPAVAYADIEEKISVKGRLHRTVRQTVKAQDLEQYQWPFVYNHSTVEFGLPGTITNEISHEVKIHRKGVYTVCKYAGRYFTAGELDIPEEEIVKAMKEKASMLFGAIQACSEAQPITFSFSSKS